MIIRKAHIKKFRGFKDLTISLGSQLTLIAGQNGTQKSTLLGILSQPFTITEKSHPLYSEKPLCGGNYKSAFHEKFRISKKFDKPKEHEWTISFSQEDSEDFTLTSYPRGDTIRFWKKGTKSAGSGYIQLPVIFLSLKRLFPMGEDNKIDTSASVSLSSKESEWFEDSYNKILLSQDELEQVDYLESSNKQTLGVSTKNYDWNSNSAGQDNLSKILLAILSFKRLSEKYKNGYEGGILAIDEIDATLFPASQEKLFDFLLSFSSKYKIQIIATTHSLSLLKKACEVYKNPARNEKVRTAFIKKPGTSLVIEENPTYDTIRSNLYVNLRSVPSRKIDIYVEDKEAKDFSTAILGRKFKGMNFVNCSLGCGNLIQLVRKKVPSFTFPNSIVILDGDARTGLKKNNYKNIIFLPSKLSPEQLIADFLKNKISPDDEFWMSKHQDYSLQVCFRNFSFNDIMSNRDKAKKWYQEQKESGVWGQGARSVYKELLGREYQDEKEAFIREFEKVYNAILE